MPPPDARTQLASLARRLRLRLEDAGRAGLAAVPPAATVAREAGPPEDEAAEALPEEAPVPEDRVVAAVKEDLAARVAAQDALDFGTPDLEDGVSREQALSRIAAEVAECDRCPELVANRTLTVPGQGNPHARLVFCGEGPGQEEDRQGLAFVGRAGELLTKMIESIDLTRDEVFILNIVKCRPPDNRNPAPLEASNCRPYLARQLEVLRPRVIVALGGVAAKNLLETNDGIGRLRGRFYPWRGALLMPTYHPAYVLRNYTPDTRRMVYEDLLKVKEELDRFARDGA